MALKRFSHLGAAPHPEPVTEDVRGFQVLDSTCKPIGIVDDFLVDTDNDKSVNYVLVGQGSVTTMLSGKELIIPLAHLNIDADSRTALLDITLDQLWDFPTYDTLDDPDLKDKVVSFFAAAALHPITGDVTVHHPASMETPAPIPPEVEPSKMPAGKPLVAAGLESPVPEEVIRHAVEVAEGRAAEAERPKLEVVPPEAEKPEEERPEKPAA